VLSTQPPAAAAVIDTFMPRSISKATVHGKKIYQERCIPVIASAMKVMPWPGPGDVKNTGKEKLLVNIIDPNREVRPNSQATSSKRKTMKFHRLIANETSIAVNLRQAYAKKTSSYAPISAKSKVRANPSCRRP